MDTCIKNCPFLKTYSIDTNYNMNCVYPVRVYEAFSDCIGNKCMAWNEDKGYCMLCEQKKDYAIYKQKEDDKEE